MIPALLARKFDTIIASMSITEERKKKVDFTVKYYNTPAMLVAKKNAGFDDTADGLKYKRVGVQRATTHQCSAEKLYPDAEIVLYATQEEVWQDLAAGRLDGFWETGLHKWDMAAGALIIREAGGIISDMNGSENFLDTGHVLTGSPKIYSALMKLLAPDIKALFNQK